MNSIESNGVTIYYEVIKKRNKNLYARMDKSGNIIVTAPYLVSKRVIENFVSESYFKLQKKMEKRKDKTIVKDGKIKVLGISYDVSSIDDINYFLTLKLKEYIKERYVDICKNMGILNIPVVRFKRVKGYLGEYNKKTHSINLNILIGHLDMECVEYVIVHELCHIRYMNHQKEFWMEVKKYFPNYTLMRNKCKKEFVYYENY